MRSALRKLLSLGVRRTRFSAIFAGISREGHVILVDVKGPAMQIPYTWVSQSDWQGPLCLPGDEVQIEASLGPYERRDRSVDFGLRDARVV